MAIASVLIALISILGRFSYFLPFFYGALLPIVMSFMAGIVGLVLGILAFRRKTRRRIAIAGIVLSSLVILFPVIGLIAWIIVE